MDLSLFASPLVLFLVFLLFGWGVLYPLGRRMAGAPMPEVGKDEPYACGEEYQAERFQFGYAKFFIAALFFTVMHVAIMTIATVPSGANAWKAMGYLAVIAISVSILYVDFD